MQAEEAIALCMAEEGFEYLPIDVSEPSEFAAPLDGVSTPADIPRLYGYQIVLGNSPSNVGDRLMQGTPNDVLVAGLSSAERDSYFLRLNGSGLAQLNSGEPYRPNLENDGCKGVAYAADTARFQAMADPEFADLLESVSAIPQRTAEISSVIDALANWSDCMADSGHPGLIAKNDGQKKAWQRWSELSGLSISFAEDGSIESAPAVPISELDIKTSELADFLIFEKDLAVDDFTCATTYNAAFDSARIQLEYKFLEENAAEIEKFRTAANMN